MRTPESGPQLRVLAEPRGDLVERGAHGPELARDDLVQRQLAPEPRLVRLVDLLVAELLQHDVERVDRGHRPVPVEDDVHAVASRTDASSVPMSPTSISARASGGDGHGLERRPGQQVARQERRPVGREATGLSQSKRANGARSASAPPTRTTPSSSPGAEVLGRQDDRAEPEREVAILRLRPPRVTPLREDGVAADHTVRSDHGREAGEQHEAGRPPVGRGDVHAGPDDRGRVGERERAAVVEDADRGRVQHRCEQAHPFARVDGVLRAPTLRR